MPSTSPNGGNAEHVTPPSGFGLPRAARLTRTSDFRRVYGRGRRAHGKTIVLVALRRQEPGHRVGVAVSKEHGRAVRRNKLKRILREAFRLERPELPGAFDVVLIPRKLPGRLVLAEVRRELVDLFRRMDDETVRPPRRPRRRKRP